MNTPRHPLAATFRQAVETPGQLAAMPGQTARTPRPLAEAFDQANLWLDQAVLGLDQLAESFRQAILLLRQLAELLRQPTFGSASWQNHSAKPSNHSASWRNGSASRLLARPVGGSVPPSRLFVLPTGRIPLPSPFSRRAHRLSGRLNRVWYRSIDIPFWFLAIYSPPRGIASNKPEVENRETLSVVIKNAPQWLAGRLLFTALVYAPTLASSSFDSTFTILNCSACIPVSARKESLPK